MTDVRPVPRWADEAYDREALPERVMQFGTGALLRAVCAAAVDNANCARAFNGRVIVVQSTQHGLAREINDQNGLFTLVERGTVGGEPVQRAVVIGAISRALVAAREWRLVREAACRPELQVIVSNVTEAGFRLAADEPPLRVNRTDAPASFAAKLVDVLYTRFASLPGGPPLHVIPTDFVAGNGPLLARMVDDLAGQCPDAPGFREWVAAHVHFCSSLVDRITTGTPPVPERVAMEAQLGYHDALLTFTEPHSLWAVESDPGPLHAAFGIDAVSHGKVIFEPNIEFYRERKLRLLNGAHTAMAPLALLAGVRTVRDAVAHRQLGPFLRHLLLEEIAPATTLPSAAARSFGEEVLERFGNPWLDHEWQVIATNQTAKLRLRVLPSIIEYHRKRHGLPPGLVLALAASLRWARTTRLLSPTEGWGWWRGEAHRIVDVELAVIDRHWRDADPDAAPGAIPDSVLGRFSAAALADSALWGQDLTGIPGLTLAVNRTLVVLEHEGIGAAMSTIY